MTWKERVYRSLPFLLVLLAATGIAITEEVWFAVIAIAGTWLLPSPVNVSRETSDSEADYASQWGKDNLPPLSNVSRESIPVPCVVMHGSAEPHVLGCEGWSFDPQ